MGGRLPMQRTLTAVAIGVLGFQALVSQTAIPSPEDKILARAVEKMRKKCPYTTTKLSYDPEGKLVATPDEKEKGKITEKLSIPLLFKPGRFQLKQVPGSQAEESGEDFTVIVFKPWEERHQLKAIKDEDDDVNKTLNQLTGSVTIDPKTGGFVRIDANLSERVSYTRWWLLGIDAAWMKEVNFSLTQRFDFWRWNPVSLRATVKYGRKFLDDVHDEYVTTFDCGNGSN